MHKEAKKKQKTLVHDNFGMYVLGIIVIGTFTFFALASTFLFGLLLLIAGIVVFLQFLVSGKWSSFMLHLFGGLLLFGTGLFIMLNQSISLFACILLVSLVFLAIGVSKIAASVTERDAGWGWDFTGGILIFGLGLLIWRFPISTSIGVLGLFLGLAILAAGISELLSGAFVHKSSTRSNIAV